MSALRLWRTVYTLSAGAGALSGFAAMGASVYTGADRGPRKTPGLHLSRLAMHRELTLITRPACRRVI